MLDFQDAFTGGGGWEGHTAVLPDLRALRPASPAPALAGRPWDVSPLLWVSISPSKNSPSSQSLWTCCIFLTPWTPHLGTDVSLIHSGGPKDIKFWPHLSWPRPRTLAELFLAQRSANTLCKGPGSTHFRLGWPRGVRHDCPILQLQLKNRQSMNKWV